MVAVADDRGAGDEPEFGVGRIQFIAAESQRVKQSGTSKNRRERAKFGPRSGHVPSVRRAPEARNSHAQ